MNGNVVVCPGDMVTMAFYSYSVDLRPHDVAVDQQPHAGAIGITRPVKP
jgi:hypothetical protein